MRYFRLLSDKVTVKEISRGQYQVLVDSRSSRTRVLAVAGRNPVTLSRCRGSRFEWIDTSVRQLRRLLELLEE